MKVGKSAETYQVGAHFKALDEGAQVGAHFEALDEGALLLPLDPRYTQLGFNLIFVQVWHYICSWQ